MAVRANAASSGCAAPDRGPPRAGPGPRPRCSWLPDPRRPPAAALHWSAVPQFDDGNVVVTRAVPTPTVRNDARRHAKTFALDPPSEPVLPARPDRRVRPAGTAGVYVKSGTIAAGTATVQCNLTTDKALGAGF